MRSGDVTGGSYTGATAQAAAEGEFWPDLIDRCHGSWTCIGGKLNEQGVCEYMDPAGDKFFGVYNRDHQGGTWKVLGRTGQYDGIVSAGKFTVRTKFDPLQDETAACFHQSGTVKLK